MLESYSSSRHHFMQRIRIHLQWACSLFVECRNYVKSVSATMLWYLIESLILSNVSSQFIYIIIWSNVPNAALLDEKQHTLKIAVTCARNWETIYWNRSAFRWVIDLMFQTDRPQAAATSELILFCFLFDLHFNVIAVIDHIISYHQFFRECKRWMKSRICCTIAAAFAAIIKFIRTADVDYCLWYSYRLFGYRTNQIIWAQAEVWSIFSTWHMH